MEVQKPFGFVTACYSGDKFMVGATLASMRHFCPDVPICLIADGDVDVSDLEQEYDLIVLRIDALPSREMSQRITGSYLAKLAAMWEGPFEFYVWMDSDAILWGDITERIQTDLDFQIFWPETSISVDADEVPEWLPHFYFKLEGVHKFDPDFEWRGHPYFSAGVYASRRNVISYEEWVDTLAWNDQVPGGIFQFGDQGLLNYLVLAKSQRGEIKSGRTDLQWTRSWGHTELDRDCAQAGWRFPERLDNPRILHFCGRKPFVFDFKSYSRPFTIARLAHYRRSHSFFGAWFCILLQDTRTLLGKIRGKLKRSLSSR